MLPSTDPGLLAARVSMRPRDTDRHGKISGGVILSIIDLAGAYVARRMCSQEGIDQKFVTRVLSDVEFDVPVLVGDVVSCYGSIVRVGTKSVTVHIDVKADRRGTIIDVTQADLVFVAIDETGAATSIKCRASELCPSTAPAPNQATVKPVPAVPIASDTLPVRTPEPERILAVHRRMLPKDTNDMGNIFGGVLLSAMDEAGDYVASRICSRAYIDRCVTRRMVKVEFTKAVHVGDVLHCYGAVTNVGRTSVTVHVDVQVDRKGQMLPVTHADIVYVAVTRTGRPAVIGCKRAKKKRTSSKRPVQARKGACGGHKH